MIIRNRTTMMLRRRRSSFRFFCDLTQNEGVI